MIEPILAAFLGVTIVVSSTKITELSNKVSFLEEEVRGLRHDLTRETKLRFDARVLMNLQNEAISKVYTKLESNR